MQIGDRISLELSGMAYGGEALGRHDSGRMVFVPFGLPGEVVEVELEEVHKRWARGRMLQFKQASPKRIQPRCQHFGQCGGCHYQHLGYGDQLAVKSEILAEQLQRIGGIQGVQPEDPISAEPAWNYRNRIRFHLTKEAELAFHSHGGGGLMPVRECHLPHAQIGDLWPRLEIDPGMAVAEVELRRDTRGDCHVVLHGSGGPELQLEIDGPASVLWLENGDSVVLAGDPYGWMEVKDMTFRLSPGSFFQVHDALAEPLVDLVIRAAKIEHGARAVDLFAGVGLFSAFLAQAGAQVMAVESSESACADFEVNLSRSEGVELYQANVEVVLPALKPGPHVVLVDPPRAGLGRSVVEQLLRLQPPRLVYVSCDPATLARDGKQLQAGGYHLQQITPVDLFPQTYHIESVSVWLKGEAAVEGKRPRRQAGQ